MNDSTKFHRSAGRFASAALLAVLAPLAWSSNAHAAPCLVEAAGESLNCTANDLGIASITVGVISNGCDGTLGDTFTFDGTLNTDGGTQRFDIGFYIGADPLDSTDDDCSVAIIPPGVSNIDGDACGDSSNLAQAIPVTAITAPCQDSNGDGFFDVNTCVAYDNSAGSVCTGPQDAIPGTKSKCSCDVVETTEQVPHCTLPEFADRCEDNNPCTNDICNTVESGLGDLFGCSHTNNTNPCRASAGGCDAAENCTNGACPADGFLTSVCRSSTGVCDQAESCTGSSATCPTDAFLTSVCRAANGICDVAESCNGSSGACPVNDFSDGSTCRASGGVCDVAEVCSGTAADCPVNDFSQGNTCRASGGVCDVIETCSGSSANCPADDFSDGNTCRASNGVCDVIETCTGSAASCPADDFSDGNTCRASNGVCDVAETCSGAAAVCPADDFLDGTLCRGSNGVCDAAETCSGAAAGCPADDFLDGTPCRSSTGICDQSEICSGSAAACPADVFGAGSVCRASAGVCDVAETCAGSANVCPDDAFVSPESTCRASGGVCDIAESCSGTAAACPANGFVASTTLCRADAGQCDVAENCTGGAAACPTDGFVAEGTTCSLDENLCTTEECNASGVCVAGENSLECDDGLFCNGDDTCVDGACNGHEGDPCAGGGICGDNCQEATDSCFDSAATVCRPSGGNCDIAENCTGTSGACPTNTFVLSSTTCRASGGVCDTAENCSGSSATCPSNGFVSSATTCRASGGICDIAELCTGSSASCPANGFLGTTTVCRADAGDCDVAERCSGSSATCAANGFEPGGTACNTDNEVCTNDTCNASGVCQHTNNTAPCDDGLFCTVDDTCGGGECEGDPRVCSNPNECVDSSCNESTNSCQFDPQNEECDDQDQCTNDICDVEVGCRNIFACEDICRTTNFYSKRASGDDNVVQDILDAVGGLEVCGEEVTETSINNSVEGLGLDSALEGLCVKVSGHKERSLYRELIATALNCTMSGSFGDADFCDEVVNRFVDVDFTNCDDLCSGELEVSGDEFDDLADDCIEQLECYNKGGEMIGDKCALGECDVTEELCGGSYGPCPPVAVGQTFPILQVCERFSDNCRDEQFCQDALEVCPERLKSSGSRACKDARKNDCTIDFCSIYEE